MHMSRQPQQRRRSTLVLTVTAQLPNLISLFRLGVALYGLQAGLRPAPFLPAVVGSFLLSAALDLVDGWFARWLGAASTLGAVLDLVVDAAMWFALYYLALVVTAPAYATAFTLLMSLELATTGTSLWSVFAPHCDPKAQEHWKERFEECQDRTRHVNPLRRLAVLYFSDGMKNAWAAAGNVSHLLLPLAIICRRHTFDDSVTGNAWSRCSLLVLLFSLPGFALYVVVTLFMLGDFVTRHFQNFFRYCHTSMVAGSAFACVAAYHALTTPLCVSLVISAFGAPAVPNALGQHCSPEAVWCAQAGAPGSAAAFAARASATAHWMVLAQFLSFRAVTLVLVILLARRSSRQVGFILRWATALWTLAITGHLGYREIGSLLPYLHAGRYLSDVEIDKAVLRGEAWLFQGLGGRAGDITSPTGSSTFQPVRDFGSLIGATRGTACYEAWYSLYFSFMPVMLSLVLIVAAPSICGALHFGTGGDATDCDNVAENKVAGSADNGPLANSIRDFDFFTLRIVGTFCCCWISYLCCPVYGPVIMLGPRDASMGSIAIQPGLDPVPEAVSSLVWSMGKSFASTGTALPSTHCAVTVAAALAAYDSIMPRNLSASNKKRTFFSWIWLARGTTVFAGLTCIAVVVCGMHYVSDVVAGGFAAALVSVLLPRAEL